jgi:hypothetical protein
MSQPVRPPVVGPVRCCGGPRLGELSGGKWMSARSPRLLSPPFTEAPAGRGRRPVGRSMASLPRLTALAPPSYHWLGRHSRVLGGTVSRWLRAPSSLGPQGSYLVDSASSHMLVSKIKPCMSKYKQSIRRNCEWLIKSVIVYLIVLYYMDNRGNSRANTC